MKRSKKEIKIKCSQRMAVCLKSWETEILNERELELCVGNCFVGFEESNPLHRMIGGTKICRFIEIIIAANKMKTSSLTRYLWHLMILFIPISTESIYNRYIQPQNQPHIRIHVMNMRHTQHFEHDTIRTLNTSVFTAPIEHCSSEWK